MTRQPGAALVIGATSDIGRAIAGCLASQGHPLQLAARDRVRLEREANHLRARWSVDVSVHQCDVLATDAGTSLLDELEPLPEVAVCVVGMLGDQREAETNLASAELVMRTNYLGPALLLGALGERFEKRGDGVIVGVSSVAGERGRATNYIYGSAKAGLSAFLSGLRNRLVGANVHVVTVKPGFVRTRMTAGIELPACLTAEPVEVADGVVKAICKRRDVVYVRRVWGPVMLAIRAIPEAVFKRLKL